MLKEATYAKNVNTPIHESNILGKLGKLQLDTQENNRTTHQLI